MELAVFLKVSYQERHPCIPVLHQICLKTHKCMLNLNAQNKQLRSDNCVTPAVLYNNAVLHVSPSQM